jgi:signal transduction histidine kinase
VRDTGIGIRPEDMARLAADFQQVDGTAERYGGTGLGLSIAKKLAQLLGGYIAVRSRYEQGTTFALFLPASAPRWRAAA